MNLAIITYSDDQTQKRICARWRYFAHMSWSPVDAIITELGQCVLFACRDNYGNYYGQPNRI